VALGSPHLKPAYAPEREEQLLFTLPGQAGWADPNSPHRCGGCAHWLKARGAAGRCSEFTRMMRKKGPLVPASARVCRSFSPRDPS
jgi:hypothetical protein